MKSSTLTANISPEIRSVSTQDDEHVKKLEDTSPSEESAHQALASLIIGNDHHDQAIMDARIIDGMDDTPSFQSDTALDSPGVNSRTRAIPGQRPWAEPPVVSYTETLNRQVKWQKLFLKAPFITPEERCRIFDLVGENDALRLYISSLPDSGDAHGEFADGLFEEVYEDQRAVEQELNEFMGQESLTAKIHDLKKSLSWEEWCAIWCDGEHQRDCPGAG